MSQSRTKNRPSLRCTRSTMQAKSVVLATSYPRKHGRPWHSPVRSTNFRRESSRNAENSDWNEHSYS